MVKRGWGEAMSTSRDPFQLLLDTINNSVKIEDLASLGNEISSSNSLSENQVHQLYVAAATKFPSFLGEINNRSVMDIWKAVLTSAPSDKQLEIVLELVTKKWEYITLLGNSLREHHGDYRRLTDEESAEYVSLPDDQYKKVCLVAVKQNAEALVYIPNELRDHTLWSEAVKQNVAVLQLVKDYMKENLTDKEYKALCLEAARTNLSALNYVPDVLLDLDEFKVEIEKWRAEALNNFYLLHRAPERLLTPEICHAAVQADVNFWDNIPKQFRTYQLFKSGFPHLDSTNILWRLNNYKETTLLSDDEYILILERIVNRNSAQKIIGSHPSDQHLEVLYRLPKFIAKFQTEILADLKSLSRVPKQLLTQEICDKAVKENIDDLQYVPKQYQTYNLFHGAINSSYVEIRILPFLQDYKQKTLLTDEEYKKLIHEIVQKSSIYMLQHYAPPEMMLEIFIECVKQKSGDEAKKILAGNQLSKPDHRMVCLEAVKKDGLNIKNISKDMQDFEICLESIKQNGNALELLTNDKEINLTDDQFSQICLTAVTLQPMAIKHVPAAMRDTEISLIAVQGDSNTIIYIPEAYLDFDEFKEAIKKWQAEALKDWHSLIGVSEKLLTQELCDALVRQNTDSLKSIPKQYLTYSVFKAPMGTYSQVRVLPYLRDFQHTTSLTEEEYKRLLQEIVKEYMIETLLSKAPPEMRLDILIECAKQKDIYVLEYILREREVDIYGGDKIPLTPFEYKEFCLTVARRNGQYIKVIPNAYWNFELCLESIKQNMDMFEFIVKTQGLQLTDNQYKVLCLTAVKQNGLLIAHIPKEKRDSEIFTESVKQNVSAFNLVGKNPQEAGLSEEDYKIFCMNFVKNDPSAIEDLDDKYKLLVTGTLGREFCLTLVKLNGQLLKYVSKESRDLEICLESVKQNPAVFDYIEKNSHGLSDDEYSQLCLEAVRRNPEVIKHIEDKHKLFVINELGAEKILMTDYELVDHFPPDFSLQPVLQKLLSNISHVVATEGTSFYQDKEISDSFAVYANSPSRIGKAIHISVTSLDRLFSDIMKYQDANSQLNLVLLGHANERATRMVGKKVSEIADLVADHVAIKKVTLLGCVTASAKPLEKEKEMAQKYRRMLLLPEKNAYSGVILMSDYPDEDKKSDFFKKLATDINKNKMDTLFVLINNKPPLKPCVLSLKRDEVTGKISGQHHDLNEESKIKLGKLVGKPWDKLAFPSKNKPPIYYRGGKSTVYLSPKETEKFVDILNSNEPRFSKRHPQYKEDKKSFPFLTGVAIEESEHNKLMPSLLKQVVDAIKAEHRITREVEVKGYTKAVNVDIYQKQFRVFKAHLYKPEYRASENLTTFFPETTPKIEPNIDQERMTKEIKREMDRMAKGEEGKSAAKSIKVTVQPKKPGSTS